MVNNAFVVAMGLGTTFFGLICIVLIIMMMGKVITLLEKRQAASSSAPAVDDAELTAVITTALAQDLGTDANKIVIRSIKSVD